MPKGKQAVLLYLNAEDEEMWNVFHDVRREVGLDFIVSTKTASAICRLVPIRAIQDKRNELSFFNVL
jgi:hypothetical protein